MSNALAQLLSDEELKELAEDANVIDLAVEKDRCTRSLYEFVKAGWDVVEPGNKFVDNWHVKVLCKVLEDCYYWRRKRVVINVPPGTLKSLLVEVFFPAWVWARSPRKRFMCASYGQHLTTRDNVRTRILLDSEWFKTHWSVEMLEDQDTKTRYNTQSGGWRIATSVGGVGTGEHPDFIIIDDPTSAIQADSGVMRQAANAWYDNTVSTRLGRNPVIIVIMQRLHKDDLSGHLLARGNWDHVRWPMRFEKCECSPSAQLPDGTLDLEQACPLHKADPDWKPDPLDVRKIQGELLFPTLFPEDKVKGLELDLGAYGAAGQLQQRPSPVGGKIFRREWFKFVAVAPHDMRQSRGWDTAATEGAGDATASVKCGEAFEWKLIPAEGFKRARREFVSTGRFYLMDPISEHYGPAGVDALIKATAELDGKDVAQREEKEGGSAGKAVIEARTLTLKGFNYAGVQISGSKTVRAKPFRAQCEVGNVYLVGVPSKWEAYIRELCDFGGDDSGHDDYVDASSCAFNSVLLEPPPRRINLTWGSSDD